MAALESPTDVFVSPLSTPFVQKWYSEEGEETPFFSPVNEGLFESEEFSDSTVIKSVSKTVLVEGDEPTHHYSTEITMTTEQIDTTYTELPDKPKKCIVLVKTHGEYPINVEEAYDVPPHVTFNYLSGAPPGECNMLADGDGQHWIDFFKTMINPDMTHAQILDIAQQEGKRMKKEYLKQAIRLKRKKEFAPGYTRRAGWIIYYGLKKIPELILTADEKWTEQLYMLQSDDKGAYRAGERPWLMKPNEDMSLHLAVNDLIEVGFNMITFIVLSCHVWDEEVDDRNVRRMSKKVMKMMTDSSDYVVQPTSPFFKLATGEFEEGDKKRIKEAAIAKQREKDLAEVLQKLKKIREKEDRTEQEKRAEEIAESQALGDDVFLTMKERKKFLKESLKGPTGFAITKKAIEEAGSMEAPPVEAAPVKNAGTRKKKTRKYKKSKRYRKSKKMKSLRY